MRPTFSAQLSSLFSLLNRYAILIGFAFGCLVLLVDRHKAVFTVTYDMGIQLNAAENYLVHGKLLSDHFTVQGPDLAIAGEAPLLTWFPPGFSVAFAVFRKLGLSPAEALKRYDLAVLAFGLAGWGAILTQIARAATGMGRFTAPLLSFWAFALPLVLCPWSGGTDSFLWATSAWTTFLLVLLVSRDRWIIAPIGCAFLIAASITFRYASLFLVILVASGLVLCLRKGLWAAIRPGLVFSAGLILFMVPLYLYNVTAQQGSVAPPYTYQNPFAGGIFIERLMEVASGLAKANCLWGIPAVDHYLEGPETPGELKIASGVVLLGLLIFGFVFSARKSAQQGSSELATWSYMLIAAVLAMILFLLIPSFGTSYNSIKDGRYYMPLTPALQLAACSILLASHAWGRVARIACALLVIGFCLEAWFLRQAINHSFPLCYSGSRASCEWQPILTWVRGGDFKLWSKPSYHELDLHYAAHEARAVLDKIRKEDPMALIFVQEQPYFHFDKADAKICGIPEQYFWDKAFVSKESNLYFFSTGKGNDIVSSLCKRPVIITNYLKIERFAETPNWTIRKIHAPEGAHLITKTP
ncbi:MAG: hypothetical protein QM691_08615 [Opitutaceae bacterium]